MKKNIGFIGLGRMGKNMALNLLDNKWKLSVFDVNEKAVKNMSRKKGVKGFTDLKELVESLPKPRVIWLMIPAGKIVDDAITEILKYVKKGDVIIDGGNSYFKDSIRREGKLKKKGIWYLDCGTSGGIGGARKGACMMIGGSRPVFLRNEKLFKDMCVKDGYGYMGESGSGHFVKMVHNGIEYGMMSALAEGMGAIDKHSKKFKTNLKEVSKVYANGSIISGSLASWLHDSFNMEGYLSGISCKVPKGETEDEMKELEKLAPMPVLKASRKMRIDSRKGKVCGKLIAAMRNQFGGHAVNKKRKK